MKPLGLYIHIPWCIKKCPYCDFNSHTLKSEVLEQQYVQVLLNDLQQDLMLINETCVISSIFIGGGTPSLFSAKALDLLLSGVSKMLPLKKNLEITLEANPGTFESHKFAEYRAIGINRLSIGIQSFNKQHLTVLGRIHSANEASNAVEIATKAGFENLNLDLMFGLPEQTNQEMLTDIKTAINLKPTHISFYQLTLEPNTYFYKYPPVLPKDDDIYSGQVVCQQILAEAGYIQYEISAYAKNNNTCQHNLNYWKFGDYIGIGAGAHGKLNKAEKILRTTKAKSPEQYLKNNKASITTIPLKELPLEFIMNQLRLKTGFAAEQYKATTGLDMNTLEPGLSACINEDLLIKRDKQYMCTNKGWNFIDDILQKFMP